MPLTRDEIRFGYLYVFGREPETEAIYTQYAKINNPLAFRKLLLESKEGQEKIRLATKVRSHHPWFESSRGAYCFIHMEKTGGTTFHRLFSKYFDRERVSPDHMVQLHNLSLSKLSQYDFVSGHFDYVTTKLLPRPKMKRLSIFRNPAERLISFYRFHRSLPADLAGVNEFVDLARHLDSEDFFRHANVVRCPRLNNVYLRAFGTTLYKNVSQSESESEIADALELATARIRSLDALGLTEKMEASVCTMLAQLGLIPPNKFESVHRTDEFAARNQNPSVVPNVTLTRTVSAAIEPLIWADIKLYNVAKEEFSKRASGVSAAV